MRAIRMPAVGQAENKMNSAASRRISFMLLAVSSCALGVLVACGGSGNLGNNGGGGGSQGATHFSVTAPATASPSTFFSVTVFALDASNDTVTGYSDTVHFTSGDPEAGLPPNSTLTNGTGTFSASLASLGSQTITATDTVTATITGTSNAIEVAANPNAHGFQATGEMGTERVAHTATLLANGKVLITGGFDSTAVLATAELYDPATGTSAPTGTMTAARFAHTATLLPSGKVLITGGSPNFVDLSTHDSRTLASLPKGTVAATNASESSDDLATAELYDPATGTFTATGPMIEQRSEHTATLLANGKVLLAGGATGNVAELYDPATGTFTATGNLVVGGRWACTATLLNNGTVLIAGGRDTENVFDGLSINNAELFNPATGTFAATSVMTEFRSSHTATLLNNGKVLLAGGFNGNPLSDGELFDPTTGMFSPTGLMNSPRAQHTGTLLSDGTVLVAGGFSYSSGGIPNVDIFNPSTGMFTAAGPLGTGRYLHTATRLNNGEVLVTGGGTETGPTSSAELYK
jgi:Galactose oxidase, central domain